MSDNLLQTLQQLVQDVIAPDVRELKVRMGAIEKQIDHLEKHMENRFAAMDQKSDLQFKAIMAALSESKMHSELMTVQLVAASSERVAVLESQRH